MLIISTIMSPGFNRAKHYLLATMMNVILGLGIRRSWNIAHTSYHDVRNLARRMDNEREKAYSQSAWSPFRTPCRIRLQKHHPWRRLYAQGEGFLHHCPCDNWHNLFPQTWITVRFDSCNKIEEALPKSCPRALLSFPHGEAGPVFWRHNSRHGYQQRRQHLQSRVLYRRQEAGERRRNLCQVVWINIRW